MSCVGPVGPPPGYWPVLVSSIYLPEEIRHEWSLPNGEHPWSPPIPPGWQRISLNRLPDPLEGRAYVAVDRQIVLPVLSVNPFTRGLLGTPLS